MGRELLAGKGADERDDINFAQDDKDVCEDERQGKEATGKGSDEQRESGEINLVKVLWETMEHIFPLFNYWLENIGDPRNKDLIIYELGTLIWEGILVFITKRGSRRQVGCEMRRAEFLENLKLICKQEDIESVAHGDTIDYLLKRKCWEEIEEVQVNMIKRLIRKRALERYRLLGRYYAVAIDGVHVHTFGYKHCKKCLERERDGKKLWVHMKLRAALVTESGFCLGMATEWLENEGDIYDKQDCETKAFYRLIKKLRKLYARLPICVLLDSLFCGQPTFDILKEHGMEGIVVFKEGSMPEVYNWIGRLREYFPKRHKNNKLVIREEKEIQKRQRRTHNGRLTRTRPERKTRKVVTERNIEWMEKVEHWDGKRHFNIITCHETVDGKNTCKYTWLLSDGIMLNGGTAQEVAKNGRCRWKIENEGNNTQKNQGYNLEHPYSKDEAALKCWHVLLDIGQIINQLIEKGSLIDWHIFGSVANISKRMFEHFRYFVFIKPQSLPRIQIRFCPDDS